MQTQLGGLALFQIGDAHFRWDVEEIKRWHKIRCTALREQLSKLAAPRQD
jgi:hypothetical protein